jgi:hypothetical protein
MEDPGVTEAPVPIRLTVCGLPAASTIVRIPVRDPIAVGEKLTLIMQLAPAANVGPHVLVCRKSPLVEMELMPREPVPVLVNVTAWGELVVPTA